MRIMNAEPPLVRPIEDSDFPGMVALMEDLGYPATEEELRGRFQRLTAPLYHTLVAVVDGQVVGFIGLMCLPVYEYNREVGWILALSVSSRHQRRGIGRALMQAAEVYYHARGVEDIRVHSGQQRTEAHVFYESLGYRKTGYRLLKTLRTPD
jgi:GNAT superfamily N-acetyltransferase